MASQDISTEDFSYETRLVVLNFLSLLPTDLVSQSSSTSGSLLSSGSSQDRQKRSLSGKSSPESGAVPAFEGTHERSSSDTWQRSLPSLPETTLVERIMNHDEHSIVLKSQGAGYKDDSPKDEDEPDVAVMKQAVNDVLYQSDSDESPKAVSSSRSPSSSKGQRSVGRVTERQTSSLSASSDVTDASESSLMTSMQSTGSRTSSFIDIQSPDVDQLVRQGRLPPQVLPLKNELNQEMDEIRKSRQPLKLSLGMTPPGSASHATALTPESEVAEHLRLIGDYVQREYGSVIEKAISSMATVPNDQLSYEFMEDIIAEVLQHFPDIPQRVAVLMLVTQKLAMCGKDVHRLVDFTVTFVVKKMATYILKHGGWSSIVALELPDSPVSPSNITAEFSSVDQVDSRSVDVHDNSFHDVSASTTLVSDQNGDVDVAASVVDSGFPSAASSEQLVSSTAMQGLSRDATLDSIASLSHDVTPSEMLIVSTVNTTVCNNNTNKSTDDVKEPRLDQGLDPSMAAARHGQLLRQVSEKLNHEAEKENLLTNMLQTLAVVTLGSVCIVFTAVVLYKRMTRR